MDTHLPKLYGDACLAFSLIEMEAWLAMDDAKDAKLQRRLRLIISFAQSRRHVFEQWHRLYKAGMDERASA